MKDSLTARRYWLGGSAGCLLLVALPGLGDEPAVPATAYDVVRAYFAGMSDSDLKRLRERIQELAPAERRGFLTEQARSQRPGDFEEVTP